MPSRLLRRALAVTATAGVTGGLLLAPVAASAAVVPSPISYSAPGAKLALTPLDSHETGVFGASAAEIVQAWSTRLFVVNAQAGKVGVLDDADPENITRLFEIGSTGVANSVAVRNDGLGVIAFEDADKTRPGHLVFFDAAAADAATAVLGTVAVGALPDMVTISKDGAYAVVANEGEPNADFTVDPEGSISVVTLPTTVAAPKQDAVRTADFHAFEQGGTKTLPADVRVFGPRPHGADNPVSRNLEPEYIAIDGTTAYASLQEADAVAVVDLKTAKVTNVWPLGFKDLGVAGNGIDPSDRDSKTETRTFPGLFGMYQPDGINAYTAGGRTYLVTANEGDSRDDWNKGTDKYEESIRVKDLGKNGVAPICAASPLAALKGDADLGRLKVTRELGTNADGCFDRLYAFGGRSFSVWTTDGTRVFDSGDQFERITLAADPDSFNSNHEEAKKDDRSDDKGPEPENLAIGQVGGRTYAFVGLERVGGLMVYDITDPATSSFVTYVNNRDFTADATTPAAGDLGPEGVTFIPATQSPNGKPLVAVGNEVSGTTTVFEVSDLSAPSVRILTINDFHGRLVPESGGVAGAAVLAGAVKKYKQGNPNTLFVSAGDNIGASAFESFLNDDDPTIDALKTGTLDLSAVGNHEFDKGIADLRDRVIPRYGSDDFALGANVYKKGTTEPALKEYTVRTVDGVRVAFIGTVTKETANLVSPSLNSTIEFGDELVAANRVADTITSTNAADVVVLLTHNGSEKSDCATVAADTTDYGKLIHGGSARIDAIVSAHTHQKYACSIPGPSGKERPVIQAHQYGTTLGALDITVGADKKATSVTSALVPLVDGAPIAQPDAATAAIVADAKAEADAKGSETVGTITAPMARAKNADGTEDRGSESNLGNSVADVYLWATGENPSYGGTETQIAFMNPGGLRADLPGGPGGAVTYRAAANVQPFGNTLVTMTLTGAQIKQVLEEQWQPAGSARPRLALGVSAGFEYVYDPDATLPRGSHVLWMGLDGTTIQPTATYTIVTNSFLAGGGDAFATFAAGADRADSGQIDLQATIDYFAAKKSVTPAPLGRAIPGTEAPQAPAAPAAPTVTAGVGSLTATWSAPDSHGRPITSYTVTATPAAGGAAVSLPSTETTATLTGLVPGAAYAVTVMATSGVGTSAPSAATTATTLATPGAGSPEPGTPATPAPASVFDAPSATAITATVSGSTVTIAVPGHEGEWVGVHLHSDPVWLGWHRVTDGAVTVTLPAGVSGLHHLVVQAADGSVIGYAAIDLGASGTGAATAPGALAVTGQNVDLTWTILAVVLLLAGSGALMVGRRARRS